MSKVMLSLFSAVALCASVGIQATRWSLDRADHAAGRRNVFLKTLDKLGLGFNS